MYLISFRMPMRVQLLHSKKMTIWCGLRGTRKNIQISDVITFLETRNARKMYLWEIPKWIMTACYPVPDCLQLLYLLASLYFTFWTKGKEVKQSHYWPGQTLRFPGVWSSQITWQLAHEGGKVVSPTHQPPLPPGTFLVPISVRDWVNPRAIVQPGGLC